MTSTRTTNMEDRFARYTERDDETGCINWIGTMTHNGYGQIAATELGKRKMRAHRVAYVRAKGPIPEGYQIDHLCRNRRCVNPDHLEAVTAAENTHRGDSFCGKQFRQTHCKNGHPLSGENLISSKRGERVCRTCVRDSQKRKRDAAREEAGRSPRELISDEIGQRLIDEYTPHHGSRNAVYGIGMYGLAMKYGIKKTVARNIIKGRSKKHLPFTHNPHVVALRQAEALHADASQSPGMPS